MSIKVMSEVWEHSKATSGALLVLLAIADNANEQGIAWPSLMTLARKSRLSERQVRRQLRQLEESGELETHVGGGDHFSTSTYRVTICPPSDPTGDTGVPPGGTLATGRGTPVSGTGDTHVPQNRHRTVKGTTNEPLSDISWIERRYRKGKRRNHASDN